GAGRIELIVTVDRDIDLLAHRFPRVGVGSPHVAQLRAVQRVCESRRGDPQHRVDIIFERGEPSGICLMRCAQSRHDAASSMFTQMPCEYIGMASRNGPPSSAETGCPSSFPARSHSAMSIPLMVGMWAR